MSNFQEKALRSIQFQVLHNLIYLLRNAWGEGMQIDPIYVYDYANRNGCRPDPRRLYDSA